MTITWSTDTNAPCPGEILADDGRSILIQTDWDYPGTAMSFGWEMVDVQNWPDEDELRKAEFDPCCHEKTDGTIDCPDCGCKAGQFIQAAGQWLTDHDGAQAEDPGYFTE